MLHVGTVSLKVYLNCFIGSPPSAPMVSSEPVQVPSDSVPAVPQLPSSDAFAAVAQLFQTTQGQQVSREFWDENQFN